MFGTNDKLPPSSGDGEFLEINEIFATIQGEGPNSGKPAIFVRLSGCNLACKFCDTDFDNFKKMNLDEIIGEIMQNTKNYNINLIVITGGEPLRQPIEKLLDLLIEKGFLVQIETNGTIFRNLHPKVQIICSPKNVAGYKTLRHDLLERIYAIKFLISKNNEKYNFIPDIGQDSKIPIYLQPIDEYNTEKNYQNMQYCIELSMQYGYNISLQIHKMLNIK